MSRAYEMEIRVEGIKKDKIDAVLDFLEDAWFDEVADDTRMEIENGICDNPDGTIDFSMRQVGYLCGGEGENEWAERMYKGIREINDAKCKVEVEAVYLEDPPCETYSFGDDEVENDAELVEDAVCREKVIVENWGDEYSLHNEAGHLVAFDFKSKEEACEWANDNGYEVVETFFGGDEDDKPETCPDCGESN